MAIIESNDILFVRGIVRRHLAMVKMHQNLIYPAYTFISRPMVIKLLQELCRYYNFQLMDMDIIVTQISGVGGGSEHEALSRPEDEIINICSGFEDIRRSILNYTGP
ncbi:unnamed protein product [Rotaria socialis]|uniref:Uncharacterized protein n=1 Tax=Rotaria socialis TaxID=392032 RepID=A0A817YJ10_9BILA|nr:unnamed protein product [Rotaria socialis]